MNPFSCWSVYRLFISSGYCLAAGCLATGLFAAERNFTEQSADGDGHFPWHWSQNWTGGNLPTNADVAQIGATAEEVHCHIKAPGAIADSLEISEYGAGGGYVNTLTLTSSGTLTISGIVDIGKDKHGIFMMEGGLLDVGGALQIGSSNRPPLAQGTMEIRGGTATIAGPVYIGTSRFGPSSAESSLTFSGGTLNAQSLIVDSLDAENPGLFLLQNNANYQQASDQMTELRLGVMEVQGGQITTQLGDFSMLGNADSKLVFSGNGVSSLQAKDLLFSAESQLDVSGLNVADGKYVLIDGQSISNDGLFFSPNVDRNLWHLEVDPSSGDLCLTRGSGIAQQNLLVHNGSGSGMYVPGAIVSLSADPAGPGLMFDHWEGDTGTIEDPLNPNTMFTVGASAATVTAVYSPIGTPHILTVHGGSVSGNYGPDQEITLQADRSIPGRVFFRWVGDSGIADPFSSTTTYTMPNRASLVEAQFYRADCLSAERGYHARSCGLDLNRDGTLGEDGVDNILGREGAGWNWLDPDGDGDLEDYLFVDSESGDDSNPGTRDQPLKTIQAALNLCDGAANGKEDIVCIYGEFHEEINLTQSGKPGHHTRPQDHFEFPSDPMRLIGWDKDGDGEYPPYDKDDKAIIDGSSGLATAISNSNKVSYVEIAHLTIRNFEGWSDGSRGAIRFSRSGGNDVSHIYVHDVEMETINTNLPWNPDTPPGEDPTEDEGGERIVAVFWNGNTSLRHVAMCNVLVDGFGDFFARGAPANGSGAFRFQNLTLNCRSFDNAGITAFKIWGAHDGVEILDSIFDGRPEDWDTGRTRMVSIRPDQHNVTVRNNLFLNALSAITIDGCSSDFGPERTTDNIVIDRNSIITTHFESGGAFGIRIDPGCDINRTTEDIAITNNFIHMPANGSLAMILSPGMSDTSIVQPGTVTVAHNTIYGPGEGKNFYGILIGLGNVDNPQREFVIKNNLFANISSSGNNIAHDYPDGIPTSGFEIDGNLWSPGGRFTWNGERMDDFAEWQTTSGQDSNSAVGAPIFANPVGGDLHLAPEDSVAQTVGVSPASIDVEDLDVDLTRDIDGQARQNGIPYVGADVPDLSSISAAQIDSYSLNEDQIFMVDLNAGVLINDGDGVPFPCDDPRDYDATSNMPYPTGEHGPMAILMNYPTHGSLRLLPDGSFDYIPDANYFGSDQFTYRLRTSEDLYSLPVTVNLTISALNDPPIAVSDSYSPYLGLALDVSSPGLLSNDIDVENDPLSAVLITPPLYAEEFQLNSDGSFYYQPLPGIICEDRFTYAASDGVQGTPVTVRLNVANAPTEIIVDDDGSDPAQGTVSQVGTWDTSSAVGGYNGGSVFSYNNGDGSDRFTWTPKLPVPGLYRVYARWTLLNSNGNAVSRSKYAVYEITHAGGTSEISLSQLEESLNTQWIFLGEYTFDAGSSQPVTLSSASGEAINADAIRWERVSYNIPEELVFDNLDIQPTPTNNWISSTGSPAFRSDSVYNETPGESFVWDFTVPEDGQYAVYAWWTHHSNRSDQVPYAVTHSDGTTEIIVDQLDQNQAGQWNHLGDFNFTADGNGKVTVTVPSTGTNKVANADAIRLVRLDGSAVNNIPPNPTGNLADLIRVTATCYDHGERDTVQVAAIPGATYTLYRSLNLDDWESVETITAVDASILLSAPRDPHLDRCFYRVGMVLPE